MFNDIQKVKLHVNIISTKSSALLLLPHVILTRISHLHKNKNGRNFFAPIFCYLLPFILTYFFFPSFLCASNNFFNTKPEIIIEAHINIHTLAAWIHLFKHSLNKVINTPSDDFFSLEMSHLIVNLRSDKLLKWMS
jgi:hypothetical protein